MTQHSFILFILLPTSNLPMYNKVVHCILEKKNPKNKKETKTINVHVHYIHADNKFIQQFKNYLIWIQNNLELPLIAENMMLITSKEQQHIKL